MAERRPFISSDGRNRFSDFNYNEVCAQSTTTLRDLFTKRSPTYEKHPSNRGGLTRKQGPTVFRWQHNKTNAEGYLRRLRVVELFGNLKRLKLLPHRESQIPCGFCLSAKHWQLPHDRRCGVPTSDRTLALAQQCTWHCLSRRRPYP